MGNNTKVSWETFLNPAWLRSNLIIASIYIAAFEVLKTGVVDRIKDFYTNGFDQNGPRVSAEYQSGVLSKNRSPVYASLQWLKESNAITDADIECFERVKTLRNELAHALSGILFQGLPTEVAERLSEMISLLDKIERWWIVNFEIPINSDLADKEIDEAQVIPGPIMGMRLLLDIALGSEEESRRYFDEFQRRAAT
jgi:hypothetical protein